MTTETTYPSGFTSMPIQKVINWFKTEIAEQERLGNIGRCEIYDNAITYLEIYANEP